MCINLVYKIYTNVKKFVTKIEIDTYKKLKLNCDTIKIDDNNRICNNYNEIPIIYNKKLLRSNGLIIAALASINVNGVDTNIIIVDDIFKHLTENAKKFVILHECGHSIYSIIHQYNDYNHERTLEEECMADKFACCYMSHFNVIAALKEIYDYMYHDEGKKELILRIDEIKNSLYDNGGVKDNV